jgi:excisionase family DNA binding protein
MESRWFGADEPLTPAERQFLIDSGVPANSFDPDVKEEARARLRARAEETRRDASPELTAEQVASLLGCTPSTVLELARSKDLYSYDLGDGLRFPEWQFPDGQRLTRLGTVLRELSSGMHPHSVEGLLAVVPHEELDDMTAIAWLARGGGALEPVVSLAISSSHDA